MFVMISYNQLPLCRYDLVILIGPEFFWHECTVISLNVPRTLRQRNSAANDSG